MVEVTALFALPHLQVMDMANIHMHKEHDEGHSKKMGLDLHACRIDHTVSIHIHAIQITRLFVSRQLQISLRQYTMISRWCFMSLKLCVRSHSTQR